jgi:hypothetical protein
MPAEGDADGALRQPLRPQHQKQGRASRLRRLVPGPVPLVKFVAARRAETVGDTTRGEIGDE